MIINDTSRYHQGCKVVMDYIIQVFELEYDDVVANGEGSMHHNRPIAIDILAQLRRHLQNGEKTALINTVWDHMIIDDDMRDTLKNSYVSVREIDSWEALQEEGIDADIHLDCSYFVDVPYKECPSEELIIGQSYGRKAYQRKDASTLSIFLERWDNVVNRLRHTEFFVTGRHHEVYAACKAKCPFFAIEGNTHKIGGLIRWAGVDIPVGDHELSYDRIPYFMDMCKERKEEYDKLFQFMDNQPKLINKLHYAN